MFKQCSDFINLDLLVKKYLQKFGHNKNSTSPGELAQLVASPLSARRIQVQILVNLLLLNLS